jgi:hypothetical protein
MKNKQLTFKQIKRLAENKYLFNDWEKQFYTSLKEKNFKELSDKQLSVAERLSNKRPKVKVIYTAM